MATLDVPTTPTALTRSRSLRNDTSSAVESDGLLQQQSSTSSPALANLSTDLTTTLNNANNINNNNNNEHHHDNTTTTVLDTTAVITAATSSSSLSRLDNEVSNDGSCNSSKSSSNNTLNSSSDEYLDASSSNTNLLLNASEAAPTNGSVSASIKSSLTTVELDATQILSQSPLFRKKFAPEENGKQKSLTADLPNGNTSLNSRLAALQKSGEEAWRQRVQKESKDVNCNVTTRQRSGGAPKERPVSLMDRVSQLESSSQTWKVRVSQSDAAKFTVAHKLAMSASASCVPGAGMVPVLPGLVLSTPKTRSSSSTTLATSSINVPSPPSSGGSSGAHTPLGSSPPVNISISSTDESPENERKVRKTPQPKIFKSKTGGNIPMMQMPQALPGLRPPRTPDYRRTISTPAPHNAGSDDASQTVEVFEVADEEFHKFFTPSSALLAPGSEGEEPPPVLDLLDLDHVTSTAQTLVVQRRRVQKHTRHRASAANPVKALSGVGLSQYTELRLHAGERELRRNKVEELSKNSSLAMEALAGLASKENFSAVTLKPVTGQAPRELPPYTHPMLLRVKGRRHAEARLVQPSCDSINAGDDFVLVTPEQVYLYKSEFANVIERAKASEIASFIVQQKDLGVTSSAPVIEITENVKGIRRTRFFQVLGGDSDSASVPPAAGGDDEEVEACLARSNKVYRVQGSALHPHEEAWGKPPTVDLLTSEQVLVFDFGSEVYSWSGKRAAPEERRAALQLARELWDEPYDYTDCDINPVLPVPGNKQMTGPRPSWGILGKLTENLETILFKEKFIDWPDTAQQTRIKEVKEELNRRVEPVCGLQPCSGEQLLMNRPPEPDLLLEMTHLGRGTEYYDAEERRLLVISTKEYRVWHISEAGTTLLPTASRCHFHSSDTYVVRWYYRVTATGRTLKGAPSKHAVTGRERVAYFFWQGSHSSLSDKGASALLTVELDEERGPHVRVTMGSEPPAFLNLFEGAFVIHSGKRGVRPLEDGDASSPWCMFLMRGEADNEAHVLSISVDRAQLRSRGCVLLLNLESCVVHLWHGCKALKHTRKIASSAAKHLSEGSAEDVGWRKSLIPRIKEQFEGAETKDFWEGMKEGEALNPGAQNMDPETSKAMANTLVKAGVKNQQFRHLSLLADNTNKYDWTPRLWRLEAKHDSFQATEVTCSYLLPEVTNPMPFVQEHLYATHIQPALYLLDAGGRVWLWQGWWPVEEADPSTLNGNADTTNNNDTPTNGQTNESTNGQIACAATTGSAVLRFNFARKAALQTALNYAATLGDGCKREPALVVAGLEPLEFINLFPMWHHRADVAAIQRKGGRYMAPGQYSASEVLKALSRTHYSVDELRQHPTPDGVDPSRLEHYLTDEDFETVLGTSRSHFAGLQQWKQLDLKKKADLF